jgi:hypothetical protein
VVTTAIVVRSDSNPLSAADPIEPWGGVNLLWNFGTRIRNAWTETRRVSAQANEGSADHFASAVTPGQSSLRKGVAGSPSLL